jgi:hypothetical protein
MRMERYEGTRCSLQAAARDAIQRRGVGLNRLAAVPVLTMVR